MTAAIDDDPALKQLRSVLEMQGLRAGLAWLNERVPHRFTAVYRLEDARLNNREIVDKQGGVVAEELLSVPLESSFCQFVLRDQGFVTADSGADTRLVGHPYRGVVSSYVGLPLGRSDHRLTGTLCHFDFAAQDMSDEEYAFLQRAAPLVSSYL